MSAHGKPILGLVGGIGSGKSYVGRLLGSLGFLVIDSDAAAHAVYAEPDIVDTLVNWYGDAVLKLDGSVDRRAIAARVFRSADERSRLEALVHPRIGTARDRAMHAAATDPRVRGFVWDSPLLVEAGLHGQCDAVIFVDTPRAVRLARVRASRGWDEAELARREASQLPLEEKRRHATHVIPGDAPDDALRTQLAAVVDGLER